MRLIYTTAFIFIVLSGQSQFKEFQVFMNLNAGVAISTAEDDFVSHHNYDIKSLYQNHVSFIELTISSSEKKEFDTAFFKTTSSITFKYFYPTFSSDTNRTKYSGNLFGFDLAGMNVLNRVKWVDLTFTAGINMGSKKVRLDNVKYKNFIFAPKLTSELRFILGDKFVISARAEQQFDISKPRWKLKRGVDLLDNKEMKYNALLVSAGIGWKF